MTEPRAGGHLVVRSYLSLRKSIGVIGMGLPPTLAVGGLLLMDTSLQTSVSRYYHTGMGDVFVGSLFAIAVFMWSYRGYERRDNIAGNLACVFALGVALFPTTPGPGATALQEAFGWVHVVFAVALFSTLAYFCLVLFRLSDRATPTGRKLARNTVYTVCGYSIILCMIGIGVVKLPAVAPVVDPYKPVFWLEAAAVVAFGVSWFTKGEAILGDLQPATVTSRVPPRIPGSGAP